MKFVCQFKPLTANELHTLAPILDSGTQKIKYYDDNSASSKIVNTYTGDWKITNINLNENEPFSCSFIARERRP